MGRAQTATKAPRFGLTDLGDLNEALFWLKSDARAACGLFATTSPSKLMNSTHPRPVCWNHAFSHIFSRKKFTGQASLRETGDLPRLGAAPVSCASGAKRRAIIDVSKTYMDVLAHFLIIQSR